MTLSLIETSKCWVTSLPSRMCEVSIGMIMTGSQQACGNLHRNDRDGSARVYDRFTHLAIDPHAGDVHAHRVGERDLQFRASGARRYLDAARCGRGFFGPGPADQKRDQPQQHDSINKRVRRSHRSADP